MGLTRQSSGSGNRENSCSEENKCDDQLVIALAGNPNTGKSTVFNELTGLNQHTGNWPGKTVLRAQGRYVHRNKIFKLIDLPGTYSLLANSLEEQVARDFICFERPAVVVVVVDATCLERNLNLVLQVAEITDQLIVCLNLIDEAKRKKIFIDHLCLSRELGVPVVPTTARKGEGLNQLKNTIDDLVTGKLKTSPLRLSYPQEIEMMIGQLEQELTRILDGKLNPRWVALRLIDGDETIISRIEDYLLK